MSKTYRTIIPVIINGTFDQEGTLAVPGGADGTRRGVLRASVSVYHDEEGRRQPRHRSVESVRRSREETCRDGIIAV